LVVSFYIKILLHSYSFRAYDYGGRGENVAKELMIEEILEEFKTKGIPLQEQKVILLKKLQELTRKEESDSNTADMKLKQRHIKVIKNKIEEIELKMGIK